MSAPNNNVLLNDTMMKAIRGLHVDHTPVWLMRQAGRWDPKYRAIREKHDFQTMCRTPSLVAEVTLQPLDRFKSLDAVILFSDILVLPEGMGFEFKLVPGAGPVFSEPMNSPEDLQRRYV